MKEEILNLTQHTETKEQAQAGVITLDNHEQVKSLLTFDFLPSKETLKSRAEEIAYLCTQNGAKKAMIGGAPFFMSALEKALKERGITPVYAFSRRESVEEQGKNGEVIKKNIFVHLGFVEL